LQTLSLIADACIETLKENKGVIVLILTCGQSRNNASYIIATNDTNLINKTNKEEILKIVDAKGGGKPGRLQGTANNFKNIDVLIRKLHEIIGNDNIMKFDKTKNVKESKEGKEGKEGKEEHCFQHIDDELVKIGLLVQITNDNEYFKKCLDECRIASSPNVNYCDNIGMILRINDENHFLQIQWANNETTWLPVKCCKAPPKDAKLTSPQVNNL